MVWWGGEGCGRVAGGARPKDGKGMMVRALVGPDVGVTGGVASHFAPVVVNCRAEASGAMMNASTPLRSFGDPNAEEEGQECKVSLGERENNKIESTMDIVNRWRLFVASGVAIPLYILVSFPRGWREKNKPHTR